MAYRDYTKNLMQFAKIHIQVSKIEKLLKNINLSFQVFKFNLFIVNPTLEELSSNHDVTFCFVCFFSLRYDHKVIIHLHINMYSSQHLIIHLGRMFVF